MTVIPYYMARRRLGVAGGGGGGEDAAFANVVLLSHFTGANGSTTFIDESSVGRTISALSGAQIQSNKLELDGIDDGITIADAADLTITGDFTFELFGVEWDVNESVRLAGHIPAAGSTDYGWIFDYDAAGDRIRWLYSVLGASASLVTINLNSVSNFVPSVVTPYDICVERSGTTLRGYIDGVMVGTASWSDNPHNSSSLLRIGFAAALALDGRMTAVRFTNGTARYASDGGYTVPSLPLPTS